LGWGWENPKESSLIPGKEKGRIIKTIPWEPPVLGIILFKGKVRNPF